MADVNCVDCEYYDSETGTCRRYPPEAKVVNFTSKECVKVWPEVNEDDTCGENKN